MLLTLSTLALPENANAQEWAYETYRDRDYATSCGDALSGDMGLLCFTVGCEAGGWMTFSLNAATALPDRIDVTLSVDETKPETRAFARRSVGGEDIPAYGAREAEDVELIAALKSGSTLVLTLGGTVEAEHRFSLSGSSAALDPVAEVCALRPAPVADPRTVELVRARGACADLQGSMSVEPEFALREDFNGDGAEDVAFDLGAVTCSTAEDLFCGAGGCTHVIYLAREGLFDEVLRRRMLRLVNPPDAEIAVEVEAQACAELDAEAGEAEVGTNEACVERLTLDAGEVALVARLSGPAARDWMEDLAAQP
ncbi:DUF1176 domain-containing protein [Maritimibacter sp. DP1N21-5]|uniref:DUF1176 domain-containing protein n=1 Tax=Maritimibacter sp. DP1N21-5 TaxID=2836867 RepID=UPI001C4780B5|nr:DUF1176 domain-containing protein [Maritimibacter sp. DP1N21-5]MBV7409197.1 DUF1176 domain-containing protein [Maritimibacter sp. DP1N21-5]